MRPRRPQGRPNTAVIPPNWQTDHAAVIEKTLEGWIRIGPATTGLPVWTDGKPVSAVGTAVYAGTARITVIADTARVVDAADEQLPKRIYEVVIEHDANGVAVDHVIDVIECVDPDLVGLRLTVDNVQRGTNRFSRVIQATLPR